MSDVTKIGNIGDIVGRLGTVKNPVLFSSSSFSISMMFFSRDFVLASNIIPNITGALTFLFAVIVFLTGLSFYIYAFLRLPSSSQELVFLQEARAALDRHQKSETANKPKKKR